MVVRFSESQEALFERTEEIFLRLTTTKITKGTPAARARGGVLLELVILTPVFVVMLLGVLWIGDSLVAGLALRTASRNLAWNLMGGGSGPDEVASRELGLWKSSGTHPAPTKHLPEGYINSVPAGLPGYARVSRPHLLPPDVSEEILWQDARNLLVSGGVGSVRPVDAAAQVDLNIQRMVPSGATAASRLGASTVVSFQR